MKDTLNAPVVRGLLSELFADAAKTDTWGSVTRPSSENYREFYGALSSFYLPVSPETGRLLYTLARGSGARTVIEFGTSFAISTIHLAAAVRDNGGGRIIGSELEPTKITRARKNLARAGLDDLVEIREGDALTTLAHDLPEHIDLVLLDGHKPLYRKVLELLAPRLRPGAYVIADNADMCPEYVQLVREPGSGYLSMPFTDDVELTLKL